MQRYRYRTAALTGPWRSSREEALADAVRAQQLRVEDSEPQWQVPGWIEEGNVAKSSERR